ncbi:TPA: DNA repair protein [Photobacterium damselae]|uniref:DNA repair protein n=1 Tax=Photobacterium damselae TaxID=38293 RepID=A0ABD6X5A9_PHODM|nr:DNA repair protein [Photobacterium damselae]EJN6958400.1 DNA repair protein [Photobacterium damselae]KAB1506897.1 DNA repair protein [Photobacterium damselae subsp. damselae]MCG9778003.1 DNA repair protein [Photobacterium damselae]OBU46432.1 DNA repair protein [Photobacterium damselae]ODA26214.1 DNA repair protein [Photobacterium damselae subsp. damselae]
MSIPLIIGLVALLLALIIGYNVTVQYRQRIQSAKQQELAQYIAVIDATEELIGHAHHIPYSKELLLCLNKRILNALKSMADIDPNDKKLAQRIEDVAQQIESLQNHFSDAEITPFKVPTTDRQAIGMLQLVKRLKTIVKNEHSKGRIATQVFVTENARLEAMQLRINMENVIKRANDARLKQQFGTAQQLLKKAIDVLDARNDNYSNQTRERLQAMLSDISNSQSKNQANERQQMIAKEQDELDVLFQPKRKW